MLIARIVITILAAFIVAADAVAVDANRLFLPKKYLDLQPALIEAALEPFQARPHWGKLFTISASRLISLYETSGAFKDLLQKYDPAGKFRNPYLQRVLYEPQD